MILLRRIHSTVVSVANFFRTRWYGLLCRSVGNSTEILGAIKVYEPGNLTIGNHSTVNHGAVLNARAMLTIGNHCHISPMVTINTGSLDISTAEYATRAHIARPVTIHDGVWIGSGAIINPGVTIGVGAVVAAGAVVTRDVEPYTVVAGVPARIIRQLT